MYKIATNSNTTWGIEGYQVPKRYFDSKKIVLEREYEKLRKDGKSKKPVNVTKRGHYLEDAVKINKSVPGMQKYDVSYQWVSKKDIEKGKKKTQRND